MKAQGERERRKKRITVAGGFIEQAHHCSLLCSAGSSNNQCYSVIIPMHVYHQSTVKRPHSHLPTVPAVNQHLHGERDFHTRGCATQQRAVSRPIINQRLFKSAGDSCCTGCRWQLGEAGMMRDAESVMELPGRGRTRDLISRKGREVNKELQVPVGSLQMST